MSIRERVHPMLITSVSIIAVTAIGCIVIPRWIIEHSVYSYLSGLFVTVLGIAISGPIEKAINRDE